MIKWPIGETQPEIEYSRTIGWQVDSKTANECSELFSGHYGNWGEGAHRPPGSNISLSPRRVREYLKSRDAQLMTARINENLVGYAVAIQTQIRRLGVVSWVTQLVVHEKYRKRGIAKTLLFSIWTFSDHFAWGIISANPYAVRALEKATRRRCQPALIGHYLDKLRSLGTKHLPYLDDETVLVANAGTSTINTEFLIDHSGLPEMLKNVTTKESPWTLGSLQEGWEWFAFTFRKQVPVSLSDAEIRSMLRASDDVVREAYSRMALDENHAWMRHQRKETDQIIEWCMLKPGQSVLDLGCGTGRHAIELAGSHIRVTGVDYIGKFIEFAKEKAKKISVSERPQYIQDDCRSYRDGKLYDAVLCIYDVIGSYSMQDENQRIIETVSAHLRPGGRALISVMNYKLSLNNAKRTFVLRENPDALLELPSSEIMEKTGNIFNPDYYIVETEQHVVYRKEKFDAGSTLPVELIVRDRRFVLEELDSMCRSAGLDVVWSTYARSGKWEEMLGADDPRAKEILVLCKKAE